MHIVQPTHRMFDTLQIDKMEQVILASLNTMNLKVSALEAKLKHVENGGGGMQLNSPHLANDEVNIIKVMCACVWLCAYRCG